MRRTPKPTAQPTDSATVAVTVGEVSDPPVAVGDGPIPVDEGGTINATFNVLDNDTNPDPTTMTAILVTPPANASVFELNSDGTFVYTHDGSDEAATDSFVYQANNGEPSENATVTISINPINDRPVITGVATPLSTPEDTSFTISLTDLVVVDPDNVFPGDFTLVLQDGQDYTRAGNTITPAANFNGQLSIPATVSDLEPLESPIFLIPVDVTVSQPTNLA